MYNLQDVVHVAFLWPVLNAANKRKGTFVPILNYNKCYKELKTDIFNPLVPKAYNSEYQILLFPLQIKPLKSVEASLRILFFGTLLGTDMGLARVYM